MSTRADPDAASHAVGSLPAGPALVVGFGITGVAVSRALRRLDRQVVVIEDHPRPEHAATAESLGVTLVEAPDVTRLRELVRKVDVAFPSPGVSDRHDVFAVLDEAEVPVASEFDLAASMDDRPLVAITGTDGKTTVTTMVADMLTAGGRRAMLAGNTDTPLVDAVLDPDPEVFVVEASSFRLRDTRHFRPAVATWLNFGTDHLDVHATLGAYEQAKARIWRDLGSTDVAIANLDDAVVMRHVRPDVPAITFGLEAGDYRLDGDVLVGADDVLVPVEEMSRALPHDISNALAAAATARAAGADLDGVRRVLREFRQLAHRVQLVRTLDAVRFVDDSKATTPHASLAAIRSFPSVVLIAGGRNKGLDLSELRDGAAHLRAVVAIGEAAGEVESALGEIVSVTHAATMHDAVERAAARAVAGDVVLLSPSCASFDWYGSYAERGDDFARVVLGLPESG